MSERRCRLYLITPPALESERALETFATALEQAMAAGDVACLQLRLKPADDDAVRRAARRLMPVAHARGAAFLINDRPDLAKELGADGVHLGQEDMPLKDARTILGLDASIGVTCHASRHLAMEAGEGGADYVAFGAFFPSRTKTPKANADPEILAWWSQLFEVPCVAIGGITPANCRPLIEAGADFLAVSSGVWDCPDGPVAAVSAFEGILRET